MLLAHGLGGIRDLPVPGWLFLVGGAVVLVVSFVALGVLWREPRLTEGERERPLRLSLRRARPLLVAVQAVSIGVFAVVWCAAAFGSADPIDNLAPTFVYVVFWLGLLPVVVLLGDVWTVLNPWRAVADAVALFGRAAPFEYPQALGRWPAAVLIFSFPALELAYHDPADPRVLTIAIGIYSAATWAGAALFGRRTWFSLGDGFSVYFGLLSRIAPLGVRGGRIVLRPPLSVLTRPEPAPGSLAFVAAMLGSVAFDGFSQTTFWVQRLNDVRGSHSPGVADLLATLLSLGGLVAAVCLVALAYRVAVLAAEVAGGRRGLAPVFLGSLVPIAFVYAVAHYFSLLVVQGQFAIPLASDPFGRGWDVFGTADFRPRLDVLSPNTTWFVQVGALVVGHVAGLVIAHDRAVAVVGSPRAALRTQYAMLALMILYTIGGMWLLSIG